MAGASPYFAVHPLDAVRACRTDYHEPVALDTLGFQIRTAVSEASDLEFVPLSFRNAGSSAQNSKIP
jgi:hypothetical protein